MESKKKPNCCCFSFFRRSSQKEPNRQIIPQPSLPAPSDIPTSRSLSASQRVQINYTRSCIVTPVRRAPNLKNLISGKISATDVNNSIETSISRPNTLREVNINTAFSSKPKTQLRNELKKVTEEVLREIECKYVKRGNPYFVNIGPSPDFLFEGKLITPKLDSLEISPVKADFSCEDSVDIESLFMRSDRGRIPDIFIRGDRAMPKIKPTTPGMMKKKVLPIMRNEGRLLFSHLNCK